MRSICVFNCVYDKLWSIFKVLLEVASLGTFGIFFMYSEEKDFLYFSTHPTVDIFHVYHKDEQDQL